MPSFELYQFPYGSDNYGVLDHTAGLSQLKSSMACRVIGPRDQSQPISGLDETVGDGDSFNFGGKLVQVLHTPGHTRDMINFYLPDEQLVFTGDTLFALGCGRLFEGDAVMMWDSLNKLMALPPQTRVYCSHEYTLANAQFAVTVDPDNSELLKRVEQIEALRSDGQPTVPSSIEVELATNPFLRAADPAIRQHLGLVDASDADVFAEIRTRKDNF